MMEKIIFIPVLASFFVTLFLMPYWIRKARQMGLIWSDMNKFSKDKVSGSGGVVVVLGFIIGALVFIAYLVFYLDQKNSNLVAILAMLNVVLMLACIGFIDDLFGWRKGGLSRRLRIIIVFIAAIPLMAINAGRSIVGVPFLGSVDIGFLYPLIIIPIGIIGATTTFNFLAGFNGLEAGQGIILLSSLAIVSYYTGNSWISVIALCMIASLLAFLLYNFYPAKIFPGDSLTYAVGGLVAILSIFGNFERIAVFFFIPYIIETILKSRGKLIKESFGKPNKENVLDLKHDKIYSINHLAIWILKRAGIKPTEIKIVLFVWMFQLIFIVAGFLVFGGGIFR
ncbi:MAG: glycosyl transferase family 4 [Nanoarchaeota archaeon]